MRSDRNGQANEAALTDLRRRYEHRRGQVDAAYQRMQTIATRPHRPLEARQAAAELTAALRDATAAAAAGAALAQPTAVRPRRWRRRRKATRATPTALRFWSAELVRLSETGVWLRRTTLDDLGVHLPAVARVGSYAATGPHIAGLDFGTDDEAKLYEPRIGVDLQRVIDAVPNAKVPPVQPAQAA